MARDIKARHGLPDDQWILLFHDLHYSHKDKKVLQFMKQNKIAHVYIPAGCTDIRQICDVVLNSPFKAEIKGHLDCIFMRIMGIGV